MISILFFNVDFYLQYQLKEAFLTTLLLIAVR